MPVNPNSIRRLMPTDIKMRSMSKERIRAVGYNKLIFCHAQTPMKQKGHRGQGKVFQRVRLFCESCRRLLVMHPRGLSEKSMSLFIYFTVAGKFNYKVPP